MVVESPNQDDTLSLGDLVALLKNDLGALSMLIKTLGPSTTCGGGNITIRAHYLPFRNGKPRVGELLDVIRGYICNFAMSRAEIDAVHQKADVMTPQQRMIAYNKLRDDAADLFIKAQKSTNRNGECGELLLYLLTEWVLEAPQIMAKMSLKTNASMPVHGSDGIHIKYDEGSDRLIFYWGEAKLHATINGAIGSAVTSIASTLEYNKLKEDINLVRRYASLTGFSASAQKKIVEFLDPLNENYEKKIDASVCLIGFDFDGFGKLSSLSTAELEPTFEKFLTSEIATATTYLESQLLAAGVSHHMMEVFFLPFVSVEQLRIEFQNRIGWKQ